MALTPLVTSNKPITEALINSTLILNRLNIGVKTNSNTWRSPLWISMDIITLNKTTKPPIRSSVFIEFKIDFDKISPSDSNEIDLLLFLKEWTLSNLEMDFFEQKPVNIPTDIAANKWVISNKKPIMELLKSPIPTVAIINRGPELLVKTKSLSPSSLDTDLEFLKDVTILAPTGYPLIQPIKKAKALMPGTLKIGCIIGLKSFPKIEIKFVWSINSVATKNGNRVGTTNFAHKVRPFLAAVKLLLEKIIREIVNNNKIIVKIFCFKEMIKYLNLIKSPT